MQNAGHSPLGASSAHRWTMCPGSVALVATLPPQPESADMRAGTAAHHVAQVCLETGRDADAFIGDIIADTRHEFTDDDAAAVQTYVDHCRELTRDGRAVASVEQQFQLAQYDAELWGRNDFLCVVPSERCLHVVDYKHGVGQLVKPEENKQLKYYALGALLNGAEHVERVAITVAQPRSYAAGEPIRTWQTTPDALIEYGFELAAAAAETRKPNAALVCGDWCETCPAAGACPELHRQALAVADLTLATADADTPAPERMTAAELGRRLAQADRLALWLRAVRAYGYGEALRGRAPDGFKLVAKRGRRAFEDGAAAATDALEVFPQLTVSDVFVSKPISPAQLEKIVGKKPATAFIAERLSQAPTGFSLAPLSDKREAATPPPLSEFEPVNFEED